MTCHACGAPLPGTARFCHKCGAAVAASSQGSAGWQAGLPWAVAGAAVGALVTVLMLGVGESRERGAGPDGVPEGTAPRSPLPAPDISQMSPEEQARRLFDRVVGLAERGAQDSVRFFLPMALGAYAQLPALDLDARYDIGVLHHPASPLSRPGVRTITLAHSPDADDAFMFWAMTSGRIATGARRYVHELADIETLNRRALAGELECTAVSFHAYAHLADRYALLAHGASVGDRYGPRVVARAPRPADPRAALAGLTVAVPGELTTAFLALRLYQPGARHVAVPFDRIEEHVLAGKAEAGLLIHEGQLTHGDRGLHLWVDMGEWWYEETGLPLPLGGNVVRRDLGEELMRAIARDLKASIAYGLAHRGEALAYAAAYSRGLDAARTDRFVGMYVNDYSMDLGPQGRRAVAELFTRAARAGVSPAVSDLTFVGASP